jgi:hypothetical protein
VTKAGKRWCEGDTTDVDNYKWEVSERERKDVPPIYISQNLLRLRIIVYRPNILFHPVDNVILERALDDLVEKIHRN